MFEYTTHAFLKITFIGIGILLFPLAYKIFRQVRQQTNFKSTMSVFLIGIIFIVIWLFAGIGSSMWITVLIEPFDNSKQFLINQIWQSFWIATGFILSFSNSATKGAIIGAFIGLIISIIGGAIIGFPIFFSVGIWSSTESDWMEKLKSAFVVSEIMVKVLIFAFSVFTITFTSPWGAILGFIIDIFGEKPFIKKILQTFRINSNYLKQ